MEIKEKMRKTLDKIGISLSFICLIHCLILPIVVGIFPVLISFNIVNESFHSMLIWFVAPTATVSLIIGCMKHRYFEIMIIAFLGIIFLLFGIVLHDILEKIVTIFGGILLSTSHYLNYKLCKPQWCHNKTNN